MLNRTLESGEVFDLPSDIWETWIWKSDPQENFQPLNRCNLLGLLIARYRGRFRRELMKVPTMLFPTIVHGKILVHEMSLKQIREQLDDLQLHWQQYMGDLDKCQTLMDALMTRFGILVEKTGHDDMESIDLDGRVSMNAIRHFLSILMVLYRHIWLWSNCITGDDEVKYELHKHHVEASMETFEKHSMIVQIPPASRLLYQQDFLGMYHGISQVVFFHFPEYESPLQLPLSKLRLGQTYHALAPLLELNPLPLLMDDEMPVGKCWILLHGGHVFLWVSMDHIIRNDNLLTMS